MGEIKFIIYLKSGFCRCFSETDLAVNINYCIRQGWRIIEVERL